jgi:Planctomycete cytochrome C
MKRRFFVYIGILTISFIFILSCEHDLPNANEMPEVCFNGEVLPIFQTSCGITSCHDVASAEEGLIYTDYNSIMQSIVAGSPNDSRAYQSIISLNEDPMPPNQPLSVGARTLIRIWIEQGAAETTCPEDTTPTTANYPCFERDVLPILSSSCATTLCHDAITHEGDYNLSSFATLMETGKLVNPFSSSTSKLVKVLTGDPGDIMPPPPQEPLTAVQIAIIADWIDNGAIDEVCETLCDTTIFTYSEAISDLIANNCTGCHSGTSPSGEISLTTYDQIKIIADDGSFLEVLKALNGKPLMPPSGSLSDCQIRQVEKWIEAGSLNN